MHDLIYKPISIVVITLVGMLIIFSLWQNTKEIKNSSELVKNLENQVAEKQADISQMENQLESASSDFTKEKIIRDELLLQKQGEYVIQIINDDPKKNDLDQAVNLKISPLRAWQKLLLQN